MSNGNDPTAGFGTAPGLSDLQRHITVSQVRNFSAAEVCRINRARLHAGESDIAVPPREMWDNMIPTLRLAERIRAAWVDDIRQRGGDVTRCGIGVLSGYRPPWYNARVGGALLSQHMAFKALDIHPGNRELGHFMRVVTMTLAAERDLRAIGVGRYDTFVHIDTGRSVFTKWDNRSDRAKADHARYAVGGPEFRSVATATTTERGASPLGLDDTQPGD